MVGLGTDPPGSNSQREVGLTIHLSLHSRRSLNFSESARFAFDFCFQAPIESASCQVVEIHRPATRRLITNLGVIANISEKA